MAQRSHGGGTPDDMRPLRGLNCLVVDDDLLIALDIEHMLQSAGAAAVICVGNVADAMATLQNDVPTHLAVLDVALGGGDSMAVPAALRQRNIPFLFLTGMGGDDPRVRKYPDAPVVDKPYTAEIFLAAVLRALRLR